MDGNDARRSARLDALRRELRTHPGALASNQWRALRMVHEALQTNESALLEHLDLRGSDNQRRAFAIMGQTPKDRAAKQQFWMETFVRLANFTALNSALIDHFRKLMKNYEGSEFGNEANQRAETLKSAPVQLFLKALRNFISHVAVPPLVLDFKLADNQPDFSVRLASAELLAFNDFTGAAREYLTARPTVSVEDAVKEYAALREPFYQWLHTQFPQLHETEMKEYDILVRKYEEALAE